MTWLWRRPSYFLRRAVDATARAPRVALVATGTIFVAVLVTGLFAGALHGAGRLLTNWAGEVQISVYLDPSADLGAAQAAAAEMAPGRSVEAVSAAEALERFREALGPQRGLLEGIRPGVIPPSIEVRAPGIGLEEARSLAGRLAGVPGAREVDFGNAWIEQLQRIVTRVRWASLVLLCALVLGAAVLVANTLRLGVFARRDEIEIMKLFGATDAFVEVPFLIEGFGQGMAGGSLAALLLHASAVAVLPRISWTLGLTRPIPRVDVFPTALLAALVAGGAALGLIAAALAVGRELRGRRT